MRAVYTLAVLVGIALPVSAQQCNTTGNTTYCPDGSTAVRSGNTTYFYQNGDAAGSAVRNGSATYFYNLPKAPVIPAATPADPILFDAQPTTQPITVTVPATRSLPEKEYASTLSLLQNTTDELHDTQNDLYTVELQLAQARIDAEAYRDALKAHGIAVPSTRTASILDMRDASGALIVDAQPASK